VLRLGLYKLPALASYEEHRLYRMAKDLQPEVVIETGTNLGVSTFFILKALSENGRGHLFSIDLPHAQYSLRGERHEDYLPRGLPPGWVVPASLRRRWTLILGNARTELPRLLDTLDHLDMFLHDSEHTYEHMMFEFGAAWPKLREGGLMVADDVRLNSSFQDFCGCVRRMPGFSNHQYGRGKYGWVTR